MFKISVAPLQALVCIERLVDGQPQHQEALMRAKAADSQGRDMPALHCILQVVAPLIHAFKFSHLYVHVHYKHSY
jgi:hypothetical protein